MFSFPREMEVSVSMKNGHKCDFFNVEEKYPIFKMKNKRYERIFKTMTLMSIALKCK